MKTYLITRHDGSQRIVRSSQFPKRADYAEVLEAPSDAESAEDLDVVEIDFGDGEVSRKVVISETKRQARLEREAQREVEQAARDEAQRLRRDELRGKAQRFGQLTRAEKDELLLELVQRFLE
jgi:hypothetical protein